MAWKRGEVKVKRLADDNQGDPQGRQVGRVKLLWERFYSEGGRSRLDGRGSSAGRHFVELWRGVEDPRREGGEDGGQGERRGATTSPRRGRGRGSWSSASTLAMRITW